MWLTDLLLGIWNGWSGVFVLIFHLFGGLKEYPVYDIHNNHPWYAFGFIIGGAAIFGSVSVSSQMNSY